MLVDYERRLPYDMQHQAIRSTAIVIIPNTVKIMSQRTRIMKHRIHRFLLQSTQSQPVPAVLRVGLTQIPLIAVAYLEGPER